ncbi:hypothetical protein [Primorskyibacter flagellatus]|uniref:hypothetical protein n=1 Tax=Primorskyibacter flagellatus TaxID=1387277 RepID=UPI00117BD727|nr:hypothetical protein [Primorskyibacter flagellatus]
MAEIELIEKLLSQLNVLVPLLRSPLLGKDAEKKVGLPLMQYVDSEARRYAAKRMVEDPTDLVIDGAAKVGAWGSSATLLGGIQRLAERRRADLDARLEKTWSKRGRPPNAYARTIALRLAKLVAGRTGRKPTLGTASDGGHPSTDYGRALEETFEALEIKGEIRRPGEWALKQLTDEDIVRLPIYDLHIFEALRSKSSVPED